MADDDLDDILDSALNKWDDKTTSASPAKASTVVQHGGAAAAAVAADAAVADDDDDIEDAKNGFGAAEEERMKEFMKMFESSMQAPSQGGSGGGAGGSDDNAVVDKQIEQMMSLLGQDPNFAKALGDFVTNFPEMAQAANSTSSDPLTAAALSSLGSDVSSSVSPSKTSGRMAAAAKAAAASSNLGSSGGSSGSGGGGSSSVSGGAASFQDRVSETLDQINTTTEETKSMGPSGMDAGGMESLLKLLEQQGGGGADNGAGGGGVDQLMQAMMGSLMSKDVLYEPMKDMRDKYPWYFEAHGKTLASAERQKYQLQHQVTQKIVHEFETSNNGSTILQLMMELQEQGNPPPELLKALAPDGVELGEDGMPKIPGMPGLGGDMDPNNCSIM